MPRAIPWVLVAGVVAGGVLAQPEPEMSSTALTLQRVSVEAPGPGRVRVVLHAPPAQVDVTGSYTAQRLKVGELPIPLAGPSSVTATKDETLVALTVDLAKVPDKVLGLPLESVPLEWEAASRGGTVRLAVMGSFSPLDANQVEMPLRTLYETYSRIADVSVKPSENGLTVRVLASLQNPFAWEVVATKLEYRISSGEREICKGEQKGFRLRAGKWSDVMIEQEIGLGDAAAGGLAALLRPETIRLEGVLTIRTPQGDRGLQLLLGAPK